jgi:phenylacetic acid degradation operon negative regulatory protein
VITLPSLSARSVALSVLLGSPDGRLPVRDIVATGEMCDVTPPTMRVALSRLVAAGELTGDDSVYALSPHHLERHRAQEAAINPSRRPWDGRWETVVIVEVGRDAFNRARLRESLTSARLAELREGVWMRPGNLDRELFTDPHITSLLSTPTDPDGILGKLWDLDAWADTGHELLATIDRAGLDARRFAAATAVVRHLCSDPALPDELTPGGWPADALRAAYDTYRAELRARHVLTEGALT